MSGVGQRLGSSIDSSRSGRGIHPDLPRHVVVLHVAAITRGVRVLPGKRGLGCPQAGPRKAARCARAG